MRIGRPVRSSLAAAAAAAMLAGAATACASSAAATGSGAAASTGTTSPSTPTVPKTLLARADSEGTLTKITGYRLTNGGKTLLVYHTGVNGGCANYQGLSSESGTVVWVGIVKLAHKLGTVCPMYITTAHLPVAVTLSAPLGTRSVMDVTNEVRVPLQASTGSVNPGGPMVTTPAH